MCDHFRPTSEPARTIYDALLTEAEKRDSREPGEWQRAELQKVWLAARDYAQQHGLRIPTMADVERADRQACCHTDYAAKVAYGVAEAMKRT